VFPHGVDVACYEHLGPDALILEFLRIGEDVEGACVPHGNFVDVVAQGFEVFAHVLCALDFLI
jgi:hypothetical protein